MHQRILELLGGSDYQPLDKSALARALEVPPKERQALRSALRELESSGQVLYVKKGRYVLRGAEKAAPCGAKRSPRSAAAAKKWSAS